MNPQQIQQLPQQLSHMGQHVTQQLSSQLQQLPQQSRPILQQNGQNVTYTDRCTGEKKTSVPYIQATPQLKQQMSAVAVKLVPNVTPACDQDAIQPCQQRKCCKKERKTQCYTCGERRDNCYPNDPQCYELLYLDAFEKFQIGLADSDTWGWFTNVVEFTADDGAKKRGEKGLTLNTRTFRKTAPRNENNEIVAGVLDHYKTFALLNSDFNVPDCGQLYAEACVAAKLYKVNQHPFGDAVINPDADLRLAYAAFSLIDLESGLHIASILTNDSIYALYEILPLENDEENEDASEGSFAAATLIGRRNPNNALNDFVRLGIAVDKRKGAFWYVNGVQKFNQDRLGYLPDPEHILYQIGNVGSELNVKCMHIGFGLFSMLDAVQPNNHRDLLAAGSGLVKLSNYTYDHPFVKGAKVQFVQNEPEEEYTNFGQGGTLRIKEVKVELRC